MFATLMQIHRKRTGSSPADQDNLARLEKAERDLHSLKARADRAIKVLDARQDRNHWRESIQQMIQGGI